MSLETGPRHPFIQFQKNGRALGNLTAFFTGTVFVGSDAEKKGRREALFAIFFTVTFARAASSASYCGRTFVRGLTIRTIQTFQKDLFCMALPHSVEAYTCLAKFRS